jgi:hypothetical protein
MQECRRIGAAQKPCQLDLTACGGEQILTANDERHTLQPVIDDDGKLISPVAMTITDEEVAALFGRSLLLRAQPKIAKALYRRIEPHANPQPWRFSKMFSGTCARISARADVRSRALAGIHKTAIAQLIQSPLIDVASFALPDERLVCGEPQPVEILKQRCFELRPAARSIVILNPQQHAATARARDAPDMDRVYDMPEVEITGRCRGESCDDDPDAVTYQNTYFNPNWI